MPIFMHFRAGWSVAAILLLAGVCAATIPPQRPGRPHEQRRLTADVDSMLPYEEAGRCPAVLPPRPVATPLPAFSKASRPNLKIRFVIGTDGRLHNMAILSSAGRAADSRAVNTLRRWRYEPALCNGVPVEAEGTVMFPGR